MGKDDKSHLAEIGHTLRPQEMGQRVAVAGDGWGGGDGGYEAVVTEADNHTFTVIPVDGRLAWRETHVLRQHCIPLGDSIEFPNEERPNPKRRRARSAPDLVTRHT